MSTLLLRLDGMMQSWGSGSYYNRRETDDMPTKSGVIGMLAAALGRKRDEALDDLCALKFGVRTDLRGVRIDDFQTTDMGFTENGTKLENNVSHRIYLSDALFLAGVSSEDKEFLEEISDALYYPKFPPYLGRKSCLPFEPINLGIRDLDLHDALFKEPWLAFDWEQERLLRFEPEIRLRIVIDAESGILKKDVPISFSPYDRKYGYRYIKEMPPKVIKRTPLKDEEEDNENLFSCTGAGDPKFPEHDAMKGLD